MGKKSRVLPKTFSRADWRKDLWFCIMEDGKTLEHRIKRDHLYY